MSEKEQVERVQHVARSGDTHVIDPAQPHAEAVNIDAQARQAAAAKAAESEKEEKPAPDPLDHDGNGRKGGMKGAAPKAD